MPNLAAYGVAIPTFVLIVSTLRHRDRIPAAVVALVGVLSVHLTGGFVVILFLLGWWLLDALWHPVRGRLADVLTLAAVAVPTAAILAPQFIGVLRQADIIAGHAFPSFKSMKQGVIDALLHAHPPPQRLPDPIRSAGRAGHSAWLILLYKKVWWPPAVWLVLTVATIYSGAPFRNPLGRAIEEFSQFFYNDPRRLTAVVTMLVTPMAAIAMFAAVMLVVAAAKRLTERFRPGHPRPVWAATTAVLLLVATVLTGAALPLPPPGPVRRQIRLGDGRPARPHGHGLPGQAAGRARYPDRRLQRRRHRVDVCRRRPAPAVDPLRLPAADRPGLLPLHLLGFGAQRRIRSEGCRGRQGAQYPLHLDQRAERSSGFAVPDGLMSLEKSKSWALIYDNGGAKIYEWRGIPQRAHS